MLMGHLQVAAGPSVVIFKRALNIHGGLCRGGSGSRFAG